jgi:hypothetical protein
VIIVGAEEDDDDDIVCEEGAFGLDPSGSSCTMTLPAEDGDVASDADEEPPAPPIDAADGEATVEASIRYPLRHPHV